MRAAQEEAGKRRGRTGKVYEELRQQIVSRAEAKIRRLGEASGAMGGAPVLHLPRAAFQSHLYSLWSHQLLRHLPPAIRHGRKVSHL